MVGNIAILDCDNKITLGEGSKKLSEAIREMICDGYTRLVLDLAKVTNIDASGIGELVSGFVLVANHGGEIKLLHLTKRAKSLLQTTKLYSVFEVFEDETIAVSSFF